MGITRRDVSGEICLKQTQYPNITWSGETRHFNPCAARALYSWLQACFRSIEISIYLIIYFLLDD